jgi:hypothetical protein
MHRSKDDTERGNKETRCMWSDLNKLRKAYSGGVLLSQ